MSGERVLVVDDEPDYLNLMRAHLKRRGYQVEEAADGKKALELIEREPPFHVLVADLMMPEMDGLELLRRAKEHDPELEVVVISGVGTLESAISSMRMGGAYDYLPKPLDSIRDLSLAVERAARHRQFRVERAELAAQVAAERERLQTVIENTRDALLSAEADGRLAVTNPAAKELLGVENLVGQQAPECLPTPVAALLENWLSFRRESPMVTEVAWPPGRIHMISLAPLGSSGSGPPGWVMLLRDVTQIRNLQQLKMRLLAQAADGLREPLAGAFSTMVEINELPEEKEERFTEVVQQGMDQLSAIRGWTDEVLALVEIEAGQAEGDPHTLGPLMVEMEAELAGDLFKEKDLTLDLAVEAEGPTVPSGPARRLLQHLVQQATWRSSSGGRVRLQLEQAERQWWLTLTDEAPALMSAEGPEVFEAFVAGSGDQLEGVGLNLAMIKSTADALGGQLWAWNEPEHGTTLGVAFPMDSE